jgi:uncharacterized protein (DUF488 family)
VTATAVYTVGVYGSGAEGFIAALEEHRIDLFCDLRARRGLRGSEYAFANATRLRKMLARADIRYRHFPELAPSEEMRSLQHEADRAAGVGQRSRSALSADFVDRYGAVLREPAAVAALIEIGESAERPCLFCVERDPRACHRSIAASHLAGSRGIDVVHLMP